MVFSPATAKDFPRKERLIYQNAGGVKPAPARAVNNMADMADDLLLAQRVTSGDEKALHALYERYATPLFAFIYHQMDGARQEAEEVWQDTLMAALRSLPQYRGQGKLFTWLCGIARHKVADHNRRRRQAEQVLTAISPQELVELIDAGPLPEDLLLQQATRTVVVEALGTLPAEYQKALVARYIEDRDVNQVAQILSRTYKATESLLSRARLAFKEAIEQIGAEKRDEQ